MYNEARERILPFIFDRSEPGFPSLARGKLDISIVAQNEEAHSFR
jgi:hypothetical protein